MDITRRNTRSALARILVAIGAMVGLVAVADAPVTAVEGDELRGVGVCRVDPAARTNEYLLGIACQPEDFEAALGYRPVLRRTVAGWRYLKPASAGGGCSGPIDDTGAFWDFSDACRTHDYGYDLVRLGVGSRPDADRLLYLDMLASCADRSVAAAFGCRALARWTRVTLDIGESLRMDPARVPRPTERGGHWTHQAHQPFGAGYERLLDLALVAGVLALQVLRIRPKPRRRRKVMRRLGTIGLVTLGVGVAALIVWFFDQMVVVTLAACPGCAGGSLALRTLLFMAIVLGLPFGGWVGYRAARAMLGRADPWPTIVPVTRGRRRIPSHQGS
jgi:hypothetical protein